MVLAGVVVTEILQGLIRDAGRIERFLFQWKLVEAAGFATYARAAELFRIARAHGLTLATVDALIATLALENGAKLFSLDTDFVHLSRMVPLEIYQPP